MSTIKASKHSKNNFVEEHLKWKLCEIYVWEWKIVLNLLTSFLFFFCKVHSSHTHGAHKHLAGTNIDATQSHEDHDEAHTQVDVLKNQISQVEPDVFIGLSLCCGFVFMLLIDHISGGHAHAPPTSGVCYSTLVYSMLFNESLAKKKNKTKQKTVSCVHQNDHTHKRGCFLANHAYA